MPTMKETVTKLQQALQRGDDAAVFNAKEYLRTNRGNKLKRKAESFREGQMGVPRHYKKRIDHAGYERYILHTAPKRYDEYGYELGSDEEDEEADARVAAQNPYHDLRIERILIPLTSASGLEHHPSLSQPYKSQVLANMVKDVCRMLDKERRALVELKTLLTMFRGDHNWIPGGSICDADNCDSFAVNIEPEDVGRILSIKSSSSSTNDRNITDKSARNAFTKEERDGVETNLGAALDASLLGNGKDAYQHNTSDRVQHLTATAHGFPDQPETTSALQNPGRLSRLEDGTSIDDPALQESRTDAGGRLDGKLIEEKPSVTVTSPQPRMLTRHQAQAQATAHTSNSDLPTIVYPRSPSALFVVLSKAIPDRNFGLPELEAEEVRRVLTAAIQKQEEIVRGTGQLYEGLLKAKREQETVWRWCRAEAHVNEMSDGEDWVDLEEWGLDSMLKKGQEEGAEETVAATTTTTTTGEKRPRGRRGAQ